jgi:hypothetical protein
MSKKQISKLAAVRRIVKEGEVSRVEKPFTGGRSWVNVHS